VKILAKTLGEQLEAVQTAIEQAEDRQEYGIADMSVKRASLKTLYDREERLLQKISQYGANYTPGTATITPRRANVVFS
jgi:acetyl-CoA carboxylase beta subunit